MDGGGGEGGEYMGYMCYVYWFNKSKLGVFKDQMSG